MDTLAVEDWSEDVEQLADLIVGSEDIRAFLDGMAGLGAAVMSRSTGIRIECAVTLGRRKRTATIGGSSDQAMLLDRIEQTLEQGPCIDALDSGRPVLLDDALSSPQWGDYCGALNAAGMRSTLGVPMELEEDSAAVLNFFAPTPGTFTRNAVADALTFAGIAGKALRVAIRITALNEAAEDLDAASKSRSVIDTACGVIISQNRCTHAEAFRILRKASNDRNQKLRDLAQTLVDGIGTHKQPVQQDAERVH
ncbi:GAF and ANTAR domain-containing protein [Paenarthrobacter sp. AMU7]|uniref:GAF and ANTAR domain-containing protein n=1 Tax=Paenarthrobacter sp. AMU7 TaxID=3162492 RepID=A0AB39YMX1_9MICC